MPHVTQVRGNSSATSVRHAAAEPEYGEQHHRCHAGLQPGGAMAGGAWIA